MAGSSPSFLQSSTLVSMGKCLAKDSGTFSTPFEFSSSESRKDQAGGGGSGAKLSRSSLLRQFSAPSGLDTEDLTTVYRLPNAHYKCDQDVLNERGIKLLNKIDEGGFAKVYLAKCGNSDSKLDACKIIDIGNDPDNVKLNDIKNELFVLEKVKHPHIICMQQHFIINENLYIFMDFANSGNMFNFMQLHGAMPESLAKKPFAQIVSGVAYMHAQKIAHRDLKLSNILLDCDPAGNLQILIADFGLSRVVYRKKKGMVMCKSFCGTPNYMAPELKRRHRYNAFMIDIYALGVMLFVILHSAYPFNVKDDDKALREAQNLEIQWSEAIPIGEEGRQLVLKLLQPHEHQRMTMRELISNHWYQSDMEEIRYTLPDLEQLPKYASSMRCFSSPADDVRLRERRQSKSKQVRSKRSGMTASPSHSKSKRGADRNRSSQSVKSKQSSRIHNSRSSKKGLSCAGIGGGTKVTNSGTTMRKRSDNSEGGRVHTNNNNKQEPKTGKLTYNATSKRKTNRINE